MSAASVDQPRHARLVNFFSQIGDVYVHDIALRLGMEIVNVLPNVRPSDHFARSQRQEFQQRVFLRRQFKGFARA